MLNFVFFWKCPSLSKRVVVLLISISTTLLLVETVDSPAWCYHFFASTIFLLFVSEHIFNRYCLFLWGSMWYGLFKKCTCFCCGSTGLNGSAPIVILISQYVVSIIHSKVNLDLTSTSLGFYFFRWLQRKQSLFTAYFPNPFSWTEKLLKALPRGLSISFCASGGF